MQHRDILIYLPHTFHFELDSKYLRLDEEDGFHQTNMSGAAHMQTPRGLLY
jgi:hypothetical protein